MPVNIKLLPDGSGRVRIHFFAHDTQGPIETPSAPILASGVRPGQTLGGKKGKIACQPHLKSLQPQGNVILCCSDDVRAVSCPDCLETDIAKEMQAALAELTEE